MCVVLCLRPAGVCVPSGDDADAALPGAHRGSAGAGRGRRVRSRVTLGSRGDGCEGGGGAGGQGAILVCTCLILSPVPSCVTQPLRPRRSRRTPVAPPPTAPARPPQPPRPNRRNRPNRQRTPSTAPSGWPTLWRGWWPRWSRSTACGTGHRWRCSQVGLLRARSVLTALTGRPAPDLLYHASSAVRKKASHN